MTIDTSEIEDGVTALVQNAIDFLPLGLAIVGIPAAIGIGIAFGGRIVMMVKSAFGTGK
jgi:hypothetical protein